MWHVGKNWVKWFLLAVAALCRRPKKPDAEKSDNPKVEEPKIEKTRMEQLGRRPAKMDDDQYLDWVRQRVRDLGGDPPKDADVGALKTLFGCLAKEKVMTDEEHTQQRQHNAYKAEKKRRETASKEQNAERGDIAAAEKAILPWARDLRSMLTYVGKYTLAKGMYERVGRAQCAA